MTTSETPNRIRTLISVEGASNQQPKPIEVWAAFKRFAVEPVDCNDEYLLFQAGDSEVMGDSYLDFCRGFHFDNPDGDGRWEQVHAEFHTRLPSRLGYPQTDVSSTDFVTLAEFFTHVEAMQEFIAGCQFDKWSFEIYHIEI